MHFLLLERLMERKREKKKRMRGDKAFIKKERAADKRLFSC